MITYRGYVGIDLAALGAGLDAPLALWYRLRAADGVTLTDAPRRMRQRGQGIFWTASATHSPGHLFLASPDRVAAALRGDDVGAVYRGPLGWLAGPRRRVRAFLGLNAVTMQEALRQATVSGLPSSVPLSCAYIAMACGVTPRSVQRWLCWTRWPRRAVFRPLVPVPGRIAPHVQATTRLRIRKVDRALWVVDQQANLLTVRGVLEPRRVQRRVRRQLVPLTLGRKATAADARPAPLPSVAYPPPDTNVHPVSNVSPFSSLGVPPALRHKRTGGAARIRCGVGVESFPADFPPVLLKAVAMFQGHGVVWRGFAGGECMIDDRDAMANPGNTPEDAQEGLRDTRSPASPGRPAMTTTTSARRLEQSQASPALGGNPDASLGRGSASWCGW